MDETAPAKPRIGISACLLGQEVRYDGLHKHDAFLTDTLGPHVEYVPVCPEVECGLPIPREAMRLVGDPAAPRLMTQRTGRDLTGQMVAWIDCRLPELEAEDLAGFIFKSKSPSSGMERVKVYNGRGGLSGRGPGLFAGAFMKRFPLIPVEDEGRLHDPGLRENFLERIFTLQRYRALPAGGARPAEWTAFHARHKLLLMAHSPSLARAMGRLLADTGARGGATRTTYQEMLLRALSHRLTPARHANVLQHMAGYLRRHLDAADRGELGTWIERCRLGQAPLLAPLLLIAHHARRFDVSYLNEQVYLQPHPLELQLRYHA